MDPDLIIVAFLLVASAFFSASETALMSVSPAKVRALYDAKVPGSWYLAKLKEHHHRTLITILVGSNVVNIAAAALTTVVMTHYFGSAGVGIATGVLTLLVLVFGEVVPKSIATIYAKQISLNFSPLLYGMCVFLTPVIWLLDGMVKGILILMGSEQRKQVTDEELIAMASIGAEEGSIDEHEREIIENVLEFDDILVTDIMTPRIHVKALPEDQNVLAASQFLSHHPYSRIPVYRDTIDNVVGILSTKILIKQLYDLDSPEETTLRQIELHKVLKVNGNIKIDELFHRFKRDHTHMAIVLDEHGGMDGLVTMEDLLEEIVGDIQDEEDTEEERIKQLGPDHYELSGRVELDELSEITGLEFDFPDYKTLSFLMIEHLGRLPSQGQSVQIENWDFKITQMFRETILKIELRKKDQ